ncbi:MAG: 2Fe-2S iron-sulfur cluster-binding protein [Acidobacteriota bacterium]
MPKIEVEEFGSIEVAKGARLVNALAEAGIDISYRCGGWGGCTTCLVQFLAGEPCRMTAAEHKKLTASKLLGKARMACQTLVEGDARLKVLLRVSEQSWNLPGTKPEPKITPEPVWRER